MWRNREVVDFVQWLHAHNAGISEEEARRSSAVLPPEMTFAYETCCP